MKRGKTAEIIYIALFTALLAVCSQLCIPAAVPFTLQTFALFCAVGFMGGGRAAVSVSVYILLGAVGVPVFAGFTGGTGVLFGMYGGYIFGFLPAVLVSGLMLKLFGRKTVAMAGAMLMGLVVCYACGTVWYAVISAANGGAGAMAAVVSCVLPFIIPDILKISVAIIIIKRLGNYHR